MPVRTEQELTDYLNRDLSWRKRGSCGRAPTRSILRGVAVSSRLKSELDKVLTHDEPSTRVRCWPFNEFTPIAAAIDELMEARG